ncbi:ATP-dependent DNA ligase [Marinobacter halodurans]|uniref:ATP-dependent DNA ligase n=1 Tax=Marinobacter halodurans TaxID=2528979 RepID=A0ABY1ZLX0_9GAMM|nr:non-homologous end-joining DNA ligase [Marinobacter halodurans]TBW53350.1 ATP-dependent DNA ligase [Marinobacter halodurans]
MTTQTYGKYTVELSHLDKILFPDDGFTKGDLVGYYDKIADAMLPHLRDRPLTLHRFPDGIDSSGFFQQSRADYFPDWLPGMAIDHGGDTGVVEHVIANNRASLVYLANQGAITLHRWLSRQAVSACPNLMIFDLDPPEGNFELVREGTEWIGQAMRDLGATPHVMTTGSKGLHVIAPLRPEASFDEVRGLAQKLADRLADQHPEKLTTEQRINKRRGRLYLDVLRNAFGQTAVAPYSVRAKPGAPVATPLDWSELGDRNLHAQRYNLGNIRQRLANKRDPWTDLHRHAVKPATLARALDRSD